MRNQNEHSETPRVKGRGDRVEYQIVVSLAFLLCLVFVTGKRLVGKEGNGNVFAEAYSAATAAIGYAYTA